MDTTIASTSNTVKLKTVVAFLATGLLISCAKTGSFQPISSGTDTNSSSSVDPGTSSGDPSTGTDTGAGSGDSSAGTNPGNDSGTTTPPVAVYKPEALVWESSSHPERADWSTQLMQIVRNNFTALDKAGDIGSFCPYYGDLSVDQKVNLWADLFAATAYYESAWNPKVYSVDVGTNNDSDTWSVGLMQMSVVDQSSYNMHFGYNFSDLQDPIKNLNLAVSIMARQVTKYGKVMIPVGGSGLYWATLHPGGKYDASASIIAKTQKLSFCH